MAMRPTTWYSNGLIAELSGPSEKKSSSCQGTGLRIYKTEHMLQFSSSRTASDTLSTAALVEAIKHHQQSRVSATSINLDKPQGRRKATALHEACQHQESGVVRSEKTWGGVSVQRRERESNIVPSTTSSAWWAGKTFSTSSSSERCVGGQGRARKSRRVGTTWRASEYGKTNCRVSTFTLSTSVP